MRGMAMDLAVPDSRLRQIYFMREPNEWAFLAAGTQIKEATRRTTRPSELQEEHRRYVEKLRSKGIDVRMFPSLRGRYFDGSDRRRRLEQHRGYYAADEQFTRDRMTVLPTHSGNPARCIYHHFHPQSAPVRRWETVGAQEVVRDEHFKNAGIEIGTCLLLGGTDCLEGGDLELFRVSNGAESQWVAVLGQSARSTPGGIEEVKRFLARDNIRTVVVSVRRMIGKTVTWGMHWTTYGLRYGPDKLALKPGYFSKQDRRALKAAHIKVADLPDSPEERWSANAKLARLRGDRLVIFSHGGHKLTNAFLHSEGVQVEEVSLFHHLNCVEGGADCLVNENAALLALVA